MKQIFIFILLAVFTTAWANAQNKTEKRSTNPFSEISLRVDAMLYIEQGDEHSITITANDQTLDKIIVEVNDGKLVIRFGFEDRWMSNFKPGKIEIHVVAKNIYNLSVQGSGNIYAEKELESHTLEINIAGSGDIKLNNLKCDKVDATITGSGDIVIEGESKGREIEILIAGSGDVMTSAFEAEVAYVKIAGSGDCEVNASQFLEVNIYGSGDVKYTGAPSIKSQIAGSGSVYQK
ncbi:MAG: head GIN domain-containing protein [Prolixibacteraceae bacterium]